MTETVGSSAWLRRVFEEEARDDLFAGHAPQEQPVLVLLGGQPAAGKTRSQHAILAEHVANLQVRDVRVRESCGVAPHPFCFHTRNLHCDT